MRYRVGLVGTGAFAAVHVRALRALNGRVQIVGAASPDPVQGKAFCHEHDIPAWFPSAADLLETVHPDLIHICTPPATHAPLARVALEAGAHVLCEKPLCASLAELDALEALETASGRTLSTVFQWRFGAAAQHVKRLIAAGELGALRAAVCHTLWYRGPDYYAVPWRARLAESLGGTIMGHGIHLIDLLLWLIPDWHDVYARLTTLDRPIEVDNLAAALVSFKNGALASIMSSALSPRQETYLRLDFQRATVEVSALYEYDSANWRITPLERADEGRWDVKERGPNTIQAQVIALLDGLDRGERPPVSGPEARRIVEFMTALHKSAALDQAVARGTIQTDDPFYHNMHAQRRP
ncbi:MAG: Gfo/Idh/MocA family oxidoreductase [Anaerolinea sp.]|nr:Gfo/Idh/MocA family oxidoreductase [Anaerolinea sp.]